MPLPCCRYVQFPLPDRAAGEWEPMGLRRTVCLLRQSDPEKYRALLAEQGIRVDLEPDDPDDLECTRNLEVDWERCPFYVRRVG